MFLQKRLFVYLLALIGLAVTVPTVAAHAVPVLTTPQANELLDAAPAEISIRFNEPVVPDLSQITLLSQTGQEIETGLLQATDAENRTLAVSVPDLVDGAYLVSWRVLSAVDGHTTAGTFSFGVGVDGVAAAVADAPTVTAQLSALNTIARWLTLTGIALVLGFFAFRLLVVNPIMDEVELDPADEALDLAHARTGRKVALVGLGLLALALIFVFIDQAGEFQLLQGGNLTIWLGTQFGRVWAARIGLLLLLGGLIGRFLPINQRLQLRGGLWWGGLTLTAAYALSNAFVSHSAALPIDTGQAIAVDFFHTIAAAIWVGGLVYLALLLWQGRGLSPDSRLWLHVSLALNFSALAAIAVGALLGSGVYLAVQHAGDWTRLVGTAYGLALLTKIGLALPVLLLAGINLLWVKPRFKQAYAEDGVEGAAPLRFFRRLVWVETAVALLLLVAAGILTDLQRGADAPLLSDAPGQTVLEAPAEDLLVTLTLEPALVGSNEFTILLTDADGERVDDASEVSLRFTFLGQSIGAAEATAEPVGNGRYRVEGSYISLVGTWQVEVAVRRPGLFDTFAPFRLEAGVGGEIRPAASGGRPLASAARFMTLAGGGGTGALLLLFAIGWWLVAVKAAHRDWQLLPLLAVSFIALWIGGNQLITFFAEDFTPAKFTTNPILPDAGSIAAGEQLYLNNCATCHGETGNGDGPTAASLPSLPADFGDGHTATHPDGDLYYWIREGIEDTPMPAFGEQLTSEETWHLVNYVRRLSAAQ